MQDDGDVDLRRRFAAGDRAALADVYDTYARMAWAAAMRVLHDRALAEDAVTEAFLRAWAACHQYDPSRPLAPWLYTITRRAAIDVQRKELRPTRGGHEPERDVVVEAPDIDQAWLAWEVQSALATLPEEERVVVQLAHYGGYTHREIAERLAVPIGTVKSRSHRAHRRLAGRLAHVRLSEEVS